jgi:hypothetical protein
MGIGIGTLINSLAVPTDLTWTTDVLSMVLLAFIGVLVLLVVVNVVWLVRGV